MLGFACRALVHTTLDGNPTRLRSIEGRFSAPAYNGDTLRTEIWADGAGSARFRVRNGGHGARGSRPGLLRLTSQVLGPPITP